MRWFVGVCFQLLTLTAFAQDPFESKSVLDSLVYLNQKKIFTTRGTPFSRVLIETRTVAFIVEGKDSVVTKSIWVGTSKGQHYKVVDGGKYSEAVFISNEWAYYWDGNPDSLLSTIDGLAHDKEHRLSSSLLPTLHPERLKNFNFIGALRDSLEYKGRKYASILCIAPPLVEFVFLNTQTHLVDVIMIGQINSKDINDFELNYFQEFHDWRDVDGMLWPFQYRTNRGGDNIIFTYITNLDTNVADKYFSLPISPWRISEN